MSTYNASALSDLGMDRFLHAAVGTESNGSVLTVLSLFARLGRDPWAEATRLSHLSKSSMVDSLAETITVMPLGAEAIANARGIASRLSLLLPGAVSRANNATRTPVSAPAMKWASLATVLVILALGVAFNMMVLMGQRTGAVVPMASQTMSSSR